MSYQIPVVGRDDLVSDEIRYAWKLVGADLIGPVAFSFHVNGDLSGADGALLDVTGQADDLFKLSDSLDAAKIPFVYIVTAADFVRGAGFTISSDPLDINTIICQLFAYGEMVTRH